MLPSWPAVSLYCTIMPWIARHFSPILVENHIFNANRKRLVSIRGLVVLAGD